jgi:hypothetical protein
LKSQEAILASLQHKWPTKTPEGLAHLKEIADEIMTVPLIKELKAFQNELAREVYISPVRERAVFGRQ